MAITEMIDTARGCSFAAGLSIAAFGLASLRKSSDPAMHELAIRHDNLSKLIEHRFNGSREQ